MAPRVDWRKQSGVATDLRLPRAAPPLEQSSSEGDMKKNSFRPSAYPRLFSRAVCNDDGSPIAEATEVLLLAILEELQAQRKLTLELLTKYDTKE